MILLLFTVACVLFIAEWLWPANQLPKVRAWWLRVIVLNTAQMLLVVLAGRTWDLWFKSASVIDLSAHFSTVPQALIAYLISSFIYYWWHRYRHESMFFWNLCHQIHHSPRRIELVTAFYKHPVEIAINSMLSAAIVYMLLGCSIEAGALYTVFTAAAEYFYHLNLRTPHWVGYIIQRPESHRIHHRHCHHRQNFADLPILDMLFGTFSNPHKPIKHCGFTEAREDRFEDMLAFRNVNGPGADDCAPLYFLPTCIGCKKRWACAAAVELKSGGDQL